MKLLTNHFIVRYYERVLGHTDLVNVQMKDSEKREWYEEVYGIGSEEVLRKFSTFTYHYSLTYLGGRKLRVIVNDGGSKYYHLILVLVKSAEIVPLTLYEIELDIFLTHPHDYIDFTTLMMRCKKVAKIFRELTT